MTFCVFESSVSCLQKEQKDFISITNELFCSLKQKRLCFDLDKGRFVDPHIGRNAIYDVESELKQREVSLGGNRRKGSNNVSSFRL